MKNCILLVEDCKAIALKAHLDFRQTNRTVFLAEDGKSALSILKKNSQRIDHIIIDYSLPDMTGLELIERALALGINQQIISVMSAEELTESQNNYLQDKAIAFHLKNCDENFFLSLIKRESKTIHAEHHLYQSFIESLDNFSTSLTNTIQFIELRTHLHQLIGSCSLYGFERLSQSLKEQSVKLNRESHSKSDVIKAVKFLISKELGHFNP
ncbi:response regulator [Temperatibacter marinus]|uniref:Response regulator n=1 Tax=Temperatibacter marinus TaxID=1456591 RepID=A0AA52EIQ3_9PROT|nr:response regulator [Temperatibacter marinus]WND03267.1 response regulator [Temperatibacter marinus]